MLDDLKYIHQRDAQDALGIAEKQWQQLEYKFELPAIIGPIANMVVAGMGGSALGALISQSWPGYNVPFQVSRDYHIPHFVGPDTLFIADSYSGNTEETLSALAEAEQRQAKIVIIAGGGKLAEIAQKKNYLQLVLPRVEQPRYSVLYNLKATVTVLERAGLLAVAGTEDQLHQTAKFLHQVIAGWLPTVPVAHNPAKQLALELSGKSIVVYAGPLMAPVAYKWKINFNENAKNIAWWDQLPEFNHNEMIGWSSHPTDKPYGVVELRSKFEHPRIHKRFAVTERLLSGMRPSPEIINADGQTILEQLLWATVFGDFVSIYLGLLNNVNPTPVELVEKFKKELD